MSSSHKESHVGGGGATMQLLSLGMGHPNNGDVDEMVKTQSKNSLYPPL